MLRSKISALAMADLVKETGLSATTARNQLLRLGNRVTRPETLSDSGGAFQPHLFHP
jgi:hypothetical protein